MKTRSYYPVLLAVFIIGSVVSQNVEELPIPEETDNLFPPERSESNSHNEGSETTTPEHTQGASEYTKLDLHTTVTLNNEDKKVEDFTALQPGSPEEDAVASTIISDNVNKDGEITFADANQTMSETATTDILTSTMSNYEAEVANDDDSEITASKPEEESTSGSTMADATSSSSADDEQATTTTIETTSGFTISDELAPAFANDDLQVTDDDGSETTVVEPNEQIAGLTLRDALATELADISNNNEGFKTTAPEPTEQTSKAAIADILAPALASNDTQFTKDGSSANNDAKFNDPISMKTDAPGLALTGVMQLSDDAISESTAVETKSTQTPLIRILGDVDEPELQNEKKVTTNEGVETTAAEITQTSGSTIIAEASPTLANTDEQNTTTEGSETTTVESAEPKTGSTIAYEVTSSLTASDDQVTNIEESEPTIEYPNEILDLSKSINTEEQATTATSLELSCPKSCVCITEGDSSNYIVDCSDRGLTDFPGPIDPKTTTLKLQNNALTVIPKGISKLKNLKVLNASDNLIFELELGSVSELPELVTLNVANNRFHEYPKDLQYPLAFKKLVELDLAGNDLIATPKNFLNFKALQTITLPEASSELAAEICISLKETLVSICSKSCEDQLFKCSDAFVQTNDALPGMIPFIPKMVNEDTKNVDDISEKTKTSDISITTPVPKSTEALNTATKEIKSGIKENVPVNEFSLRTAVNNAPNENVALQNIVIDSPKDSINNETDVKVGAKTTETTAGGGVDKSVIAVIVAGMVIIIAVITIKRNWSSIRKRFGSTARTNDRSRSVRNTNGTSPEEVPLQDKSPV